MGEELKPYELVNIYKESRHSRISSVLFSLLGLKLAIVAMLTDPENYEEWQAEIRATNLDSAKQKCDVIAAGEQLTEVLSVTQTTTTPFKGTYRFICWFRSEVTPDDSSGDS